MDAGIQVAIPSKEIVAKLVTDEHIGEMRGEVILVFAGQLPFVGGRKGTSGRLLWWVH